MNVCVLSLVTVQHGVGGGLWTPGTPAPAEKRAP